MATSPQGLISFNEIGTNNRLPGFFMEMDNSMAVQGLTLDLSKVLMLGNMLPTGNAEPGKIIRITSVDSGTYEFGLGSMLDQMVRRFKRIHPYGDLWVLPLVDAAAGVAASGSFLFDGQATSAGAVNLYIGGRRVRIAARRGATSASLALLAAEAINSEPELGVTALNTERQLTITPKHKGDVVNGLPLYVNYRADERLPAGITVTVTPISGGAANPDLDDALTVLGDTQYHYCITPYTDLTSLAAIEDVFRAAWGAEKQIEGCIFSAASGNMATLSTLGNSLNCEFMSIAGIAGSPSPSWEIAAAYGARAAKHLDEDPARPLQTLILDGILAPPEHLRFSDTERNLLLWDGIATLMVHNSGAVQIEREITTYQLNSWGLPDISYLDINTPATCSVLRRTWRTRLSQRYPRHMLANDGSPAALSGKAVATPSMLKAETIALARQWEENAWVEDVDDFKENIRVMRDSNNPNRVNSVLPPNFVNQLRQLASLLQFRL